MDGLVHPAHLRARDTSLVLVSPAPAKIERYKRRMGWEEFPWYTIRDEQFSLDFGVDEWFGLNVFIRDGDDVFHTCFVTGHPAHALGSVWSLLDLTPLGRQEDWEDSPGRYPQDPASSWVQRHDEYDSHATKKRSQARESHTGSSARSRFARRAPGATPTTTVNAPTRR